MVDSNSISIMCRKFQLGDPEPGVQNATQRRQKLAEILNSWRVGAEILQSPMMFIFFFNDFRAQEA